jgi:predicted nucleic acid-binding protein
VITSVDTSVLLDVFNADPSFGPRSSEALRQCLRDGRVIACDVVWAELGAFFASSEAIGDAMRRVGIDFDALTIEAALLAGATWRRYRERGGARDRVIADFLIGAHASAQAERLLTRDRGFYRAYFARLPLLDPARGLPRPSC